MSLRKIEAAPCWPITLEEARRHLAIDASTRDEDSLIDMLIQSASTDAEMKTGRVLVKSRWEWEPDSIVVGEKLEFPTCPVVDVKIYDLDEESEEPTDISSKVCKIVYPSPEPQGNPMLGWLLPIADFPQNLPVGGRDTGVVPGLCGLFPGKARNRRKKDPLPSSVCRESVRRAAPDPGRKADG